MVIAANTLSFFHDQEIEYRRFINELFAHYAIHQPADQFVIVADSKHLFQTDEKVRPIIVDFKPATVFRQRSFQKITQNIGKEHGIEGWIHNGLLKRIQKEIVVPVCNSVPFYEKLNSQNKRANKPVAGPKPIFDCYKHSTVGDILIEPANMDFGKIEDCNSDEIRSRYAGGSHYFLYASSFCHEKDIVTLLKAYSIFKKRQRSNMPLLLASYESEPPSSLKKMVSSYRFQDSIYMHSKLSPRELGVLGSHAYCLIYTRRHDEYGLNLSRSIQCSTPIICLNTSQASETLHSAALLVDKNDPQLIANQLMEIFRNENLRNDIRSKLRELKLALPGIPALSLVG